MKKHLKSKTPARFFIVKDTFDVSYALVDSRFKTMTPYSYTPKETLKQRTLWKYDGCLLNPNCVVIAQGDTKEIVQVSLENFLSK